MNFFFDNSYIYNKKKKLFPKSYNVSYQFIFLYRFLLCNILFNRYQDIKRRFKISTRFKKIFSLAMERYMRERKPFYQRYRRQLRCKRSGMRNVNESRAGLATIRGTPCVATPHNLQFVLTPTPRALPPYSFKRITKRRREDENRKRNIPRNGYFISFNAHAHFRILEVFIGKMFLNGSLYCFARLFFIVGFFNAISAAIKGNDYQRYHQQVRDISINIYENIIK